MRLVIDNNVILDVVLSREPFQRPAFRLFELGKVGEFELWIGSSQISDLIYFLSGGGKPSLAPFTRSALKTICKWAHIYATSEEDVQAITSTTWTDLEDALVFQTALQVKADAIITRDKHGFDKSHIPVFDCERLFGYIRETKGVDYTEIPWFE